MNKSTEKPTLSGIELDYLVALNASESFKRNFQSLYTHFKSFERIYSAADDELSGVPGIAKVSITALSKIKTQYKPGLGMERLQGKNVRIVTFWDEDYPKKLREIASPPPVLYVRGDIGYEFEFSIGIVGTRHAGRYGLENSFKFAKELAGLGFTVISGGAMGIDAQAHKGAMDAKGRTFAVFGSGIDVFFPREHEKLFNQISENGSLISEYPPGTQPEPFRFPLRNRIIAGMSRGIFVVQAPQKSGALITAEFAMEMGREIFTIPGRLDSITSVGSNRLITDGATMVLSTEDILTAYKLAIHKRPSKIELPPLDVDRQRIVNAIGFEPKHIDEIAHELKLPVGNLSSIFLALQMDGYIKEISGKRYVRLVP